MRTCVMTLLATIPLFAGPNETAHRLHEAAQVFSEIMAAPDKGIPRELVEKAECVVVVPGLKKAAFIVGAKYGKGFVTCRRADGWSAPSAIRIEGGSVGFQIGGSETDVVLLVMSHRGAERLLGDHFTLGGEGEVAAGPVGRTADAETDAKMTAEILSWSRTRGVFAGVSLQGATLRPDRDDNAELYGSKLGNKEIINGNVAPPEAAAELLSVLSRYPARRS